MKRPKVIFICVSIELPPQKKHFLGHFKTFFIEYFIEGFCKLLQLLPLGSINKQLRVKVLDVQLTFLPMTYVN